MRFVGIDIGAERHVVAWVDEQGTILQRPTAFREDREGYQQLLTQLGSMAETLIVMEATGHYWQNPFATVAVRCNPWLRAYYERLRARGKLPKVALMAAMRKLLVAIYAVAKHRRPFVPLVTMRAP